MLVILDDLSTLPPKKLVRRLEEVAADALPCLGITAHEASPEAGLTTGLWVDDRGRRDLHDLVRVVETDPGGYATVAWAGLERLRLGLVDDMSAVARPRWPLDELRPKA